MSSMMKTKRQMKIADSSSAQRPGRILALVNACEHARPVLEQALRLARHHGATLQILEVEEPQGRPCGGHAFVHEVGAFSGLARPLSQEALSRRRQQSSDALRRWLAAAARQAGVRWQFEPARAPMMTHVLEAVRPDDLLLVGLEASTHREQDFCMQALALARLSASLVQIAAPPPRLQRARVAVLMEDAVSGMPALLAGMERARFEDRRLLVLLAPAARRLVSVELEALLQHSGVRHRLRQLEEVRAGLLLSVLAEEHAAELVVGRGDWLDSEAAEQLLKLWHMPMLVARRPAP